MRVAVILAFLLPVSLSAESRLGATDNVAAIRSHRSGVDVRWENKIGRALSELAILSGGALRAESPGPDLGTTIVLELPMVADGAAESGATFADE